MMKDEARNLLLTCTALLDTRSVRSFISADYCPQLQLSDPKFRLYPGDISCRSASGQTLQMFGYVIVFLKIGTF